MQNAERGTTWRSHLTIRRIYCTRSDHVIATSSWASNSAILACNCSITGVTCRCEKRLWKCCGQFTSHASTVNTIARSTRPGYVGSLSFGSSSKSPSTTVAVPQIFTRRLLAWSIRNRNALGFSDNPNAGCGQRQKGFWPKSARGGCCGRTRIVGRRDVVRDRGFASPCGFWR